MRRIISFTTDTAATIEEESPHRAPRVGGLGTESVSAAQNILAKIFV